MRAMRATRWEPNGLRRRTLRLERFLTSVVGVLLALAVCAAWQVGAWVHDTAAERARFEERDRTAVAAAVAEDPPPVSGGTYGGERHVTVRWTDATGVEHTGRAAVPIGVRAGGRVTAWVDRAGHLVPAPATALDATAAGIEVGVVAGIAAVGLVLLAGHGVSAWTGRRYARAWAQEWAQFGPMWTRRTRW